MDLDKELAIERKRLNLSRIDPERFEYFYEKYSGDIYAYILRRTLDPDLAGDLLSDTFATALDKLGSFRWQGVTFGAWLYRIALNKVRLHYRRKGRAGIQGDVDDHVVTSAGPGPLAELLLDEEKARLYRCLATLDETSTEIFMLYYWNDLKVREIAVILDMKEGTIQSRMKRDRDRIREMMEREGGLEGLPTAEFTPATERDADEHQA